VIGRGERILLMAQIRLRTGRGHIPCWSRSWGRVGAQRRH
jgi:hypothetical protein